MSYSHRLVPPDFRPVALANNWADKLYWEKIRTEYLQGVPLIIIHEELFEGRVSVSINLPQSNQITFNCIIKWIIF